MVCSAIGRIRALTKAILPETEPANALLVVPEGQFETPAGATLQALIFDDPVHQEHPGF
jgi:hypothetical protein